MGFAQEIKDFITGAQAGQKMIGAQSDEEYKAVKSKYQQELTKTLAKKNNDTDADATAQEQAEANVAKTKASTADFNESATNTRELRAQRKAAIAADAAVNKAQSLTSNLDNTPPPGRPQAVPVAPAPVAPAPVAPVAPVAQQAVPAAPQFSGGGSVQRFADGGAVGSEEEPDETPAPAPDEEELPAPPQQAVPTDAGTSDTTDISAARRQRGFSGEAGVDGVKAGLDYGAKALGLHQVGGVMTPGRQRAAQAWSSGAHAAPPEDMDKIRNWIDPEGKMGESERNLAAIGAIYQFKMKHDDPEGAAKAAFQMLQYHRQATQRYAVIAAHAADSGDLDTAVHAANKAYANVPDDKDVKFTKTEDGRISYTYTDSKTGKVMSQGIENPDKLASAAMGFAAKGFDESLMAAIQQRPAQQPKPAVDPDTAPMKAPDKTAALKAVDAAYADQNPDDEKTNAPKYSAEDKRLYKGAAYRIAVHSQNSRLTPEEAMDMTTKIADPTLTDPKSGFSTKKVAGGYEVSIGKQPPVHVPTADFDALMEKRSAALDARKKAEDDAKKPGDGPSLAGVATAASGVVDRIKGWNAKAQEKAKAELAAKDAKAKADPVAPVDYSSTM